MERPRPTQGPRIGSGGELGSTGRNWRSAGKGSGTSGPHRIVKTHATSTDPSGNRAGGGRVGCAFDGALLLVAPEPHHEPAGNGVLLGIFSRRTAELCRSVHVLFHRMDAHPLRDSGTAAGTQRRYLYRYLQRTG